MTIIHIGKGLVREHEPLMANLHDHDGVFTSTVIASGNWFRCFDYFFGHFRLHSGEPDRNCTACKGAKGIADSSDLNR